MNNNSQKPNANFRIAAFESNLVAVETDALNGKYDICTNGDFNKCACIPRLFASLEYYSKMDVVANETDRDELMSFVNDIYPELLNDFTHFISIHNEDLGQIKKKFLQNTSMQTCKIQTCKHCSRHYRRENEQNIDYSVKYKIDPNVVFYIDVMDSLHFYFYHCIEAGFRDMENNENKQSDEEKKEQENAKEFTLSTNRFQTKIKSNKFNINTGSDENVFDTNDDTSRTTRIDDFCQYLLRNSVDEQCIEYLLDFVESEEYDTDSLELDIKGAEGHILQQRLIRAFGGTQFDECLKKLSISSSSFSVGLRFYYWDYYKTANGSHHGYDVADLCVEPKYKSIKDEIENSLSLTKEQCNIAMAKTTKYLEVDAARNLKAAATACHSLHYGIQKGEGIKFEHLLSLLLYTDYSEFCTHFSSSFRLNRSYETLQRVKKRNSAYFYVAKFLREMVEIFGYCANGDYDKNQWRRVNKLKGPFYCGMSIVMNISQFSMTLYSPTSTSMQREVANMFGGHDGMIIMLQTAESSEYRFLRAFNCSWVSRYKEEDERLFFGGNHRIKIQKITIVKERASVEDFITVCWYFDAVISGNSLYRAPLKGVHRKALGQMLLSIFTTEHKYSNDTFEAFVNSKEQIILDLDMLYENGDKEIVPLIVNDLNRTETSNFEKRKDYDLSNLPRSNIFSAFKNVKKLIIKTTSSYGQYSYSLSLYTLLSLIVQRALEEVIVKAVEYGVSGQNWLTFSGISETEIKKKYDKKGYDISLRKVKKDQNEVWFVIKKKQA